MDEYFRLSPVKSPASADKIEYRDGWEVVVKFRDEKDGPFLVDLSHCPKWDLQSSKLDRFEPWGREMPGKPGQSLFSDGLLINRQNRTQASIWDLGAGVQSPSEMEYTDLTDGHCLLGLAGPNVFSIMERATSLDLASPRKSAPFLVQGPVLHIPCQVVVLDREKPTRLLVAFSRGYGGSFFSALLDMGSEFGLMAGGEACFGGNPF